MGKKIIVIDDEKGMCDLMQILFEPDGHTIISETDSLKAVDVIKKEKPDCILLDVKMPNYDGIEVLSKIREFDKDVAVIMITAHSSLESALKAKGLKAQEYLRKPLKMDFVKKLVTRYLEKTKGA